MKNLNLTPRAQKLIKEAYKITVDLKHVEITHLHLFISFLNLKQSQIEEAFGNFGIDSLKVHSQFAQNSQEAIKLFRNWVLDQKKKPSGFGAAAKATVLLNAAGITNQNFDLVADNAPSKQGKWIPGANVPISSPAEVLNNFSGNLIVFPWNIHKEIILEIRENHKNFKGQIWIALPKLIRVD